jgi:hypothetical protein
MNFVPQMKRRHSRGWNAVVSLKRLYTKSHLIISSLEATSREILARKKTKNLKHPDDFQLNTKMYAFVQLYLRSRGSSVSIVSGYGLVGQAIDVRSPADARRLGVQAHPASCTMGTGGPFPGDKVRPGRDADHSLHLVPRAWMSRSYTSFSPCASIGVLWD